VTQLWQSCVLPLN